MIRRGRAEERRQREEAATGSGEDRSEATGAEPEESTSRYGHLWRPHDVSAAMQSIFSDDPEYFDSSGRQTADLITALIPSPEAVVVDLGCGIGRVAKHLAPKCGLLWAVDVSPRMLELAAEWLEGVENVRLALSADDGVPDVADGSADLVYALFVLQHVEREDAFLLMRDVHRMLRPGGCAFFTFPNLRAEVYLDSFVAYAENGESAANPARARMYVPEEVTRLVTATGLTVVEMEEGDEINVLAMRPHEPAPPTGTDSPDDGPNPAVPEEVAAAPTGESAVVEANVKGDGATQDLPPVGGIDALPEGERYRPGPLRLTGWVAVEGAPIDRVEIDVAGGGTVRARLGLVRDDALAATGLAHGRLAGFEAWIELVRGRGPSVAVSATAVPLGGEPFVLGRTAISLAPEAEGTSRRRLRPRPPPGLRSEGRSGAIDELRLAVFVHDLKGGGAQRWLWELLSRSGAGRSYACTVITPALGPQADAYESIGVGVHVTRPYPVGDIDYYEGGVAELAAFVAGGGHNAVLVNTIVPFAGADAARRLGLPCLWAIHEHYPVSQALPVLYVPRAVDPLVHEAAMGALRQVARTVFVSEATRELYLDAVDPSRSLVVASGVDLAAIDERRNATSRAAARRQLGLPEDATVILTVAATTPLKAQTTTALAFAQLAQEFPGAFLVFVGAVEGDYADGLRQYLDDVALTGRTRVVPFTADTVPFYLAADLFVLGSDVESMPLSILEAMAFGLPVLATSVAGVPEVIEDGRNGWLFEPRSLGAVTDALRRVLGTDVATRRSVAAAGCATVHERFDVNGYVTTISTLLRSLVAECS